MVSTMVPIRSTEVRLGSEKRHWMASSDNDRPVRQIRVSDGLRKC